MCIYRHNSLQGAINCVTHGMATIIPAYVWNLRPSAKYLDTPFKNILIYEKKKDLNLELHVKYSFSVLCDWIFWYYCFLVWQSVWFDFSLVKILSVCLSVLLPGAPEQFLADIIHPQAEKPIYAEKNTDATWAKFSIDSC